MKTRTTSYGVDPGQAWAGDLYHSYDNSLFQHNTGASTGDMALGYATETIQTSAVKTNGVKSCVHTYVSNKLKPCHLTYRLYYGGRSNYATITSGVYRLWEYYAVPSLVSDGTVVLSFPRTVEQMKAAALHRFYSENKVDNLLNVVEAEQTVSGLRGVANVLSRLSRGRGLKLLDISNQYLAYWFGFVPLKSDIQKTYAGMRTIRDQLRRLRSRKSSDRVVTEKDYGTYSDMSGYPLPESPSWVSGFARKVYPTSLPLRIVGVRGRAPEMYDPGLLQDLDHICTRYLATGPTNLAWQTLRFSFVFDWFVDTAGILDRLDNALQSKAKKTVDRCWSSEKFAYIAPTHFKNVPNGYEYDEFQGQQVMLSEYKTYRRSPLDPGIVIQGSGRFGKKQASLSLALIHQLVANLKR